LRRVSETTATTETAKAAEATEATDTARKEETGGSTTELAEPAHNRLLLLVIAVLSAAIIGGFWLFLKYGTYGIWIRATTHNGLVVDLRQDRDQTNPGCRQW
jgi:branched-subunit amino acid ABC-type transport system permease component